MKQELESVSMEEQLISRRGGEEEEEQNLWLPFLSLVQALKPLFKCLGLDLPPPSSSSCKPESYPTTEAKVLKVEVSARSMHVDPKEREKHHATPSSPGKVNHFDL
ncbi:PREDICTED: elicitor peptide 1-like [Tarenaya hassleriana]|uniref:elicitor peptide 1-like n=1 Tax=Tarenaya hassleriana TaxID=28532 RepID=UPI00053C12BE|nr:PREDICTED: elicitor peptide 1-like [Tarenaya hassleriana]